MMSLFNKFLNYVLQLIRKWWRPVAALAIAGTLVVNGIIIPLMNKTVADLPGLAALVAAVASAFAVREWGKMRGND